MSGRQQTFKHSLIGRSDKKACSREQWAPMFHCTLIGHKFSELSTFQLTFITKQAIKNIKINYILRKKALQEFLEGPRLKGINKFIH